MTKQSEAFRVLLVSHHPIVRAGFLRLLDGEHGLEVVAEAGDLDTAVALAQSRSPDLVIVDIDAGQDHVEDAIGRFLAVNARLAVLVVSGSRDPGTKKRAMASGAERVVYKDEETEDLIHAVRAVLASDGEAKPAHEPPRESTVARGLTAAGTDQAKLASLTRQERCVLTLVVAGMPNRPIAKRLSISERTVRNHMTAILQKLNLTNRVGLILFAYQHGLAPRLDGSRMAR